MITVREVNSSRDLETVWRLTHDMYVAQGYALPQRDGMLVHYPQLEQIPQTTVWVAADEQDRILGTLSFTEDSSVGLHVDDDFKDIADRIRGECQAAGKKLGASWRIVTRPECRNTLEVVLAMITRYVEFIATHEFQTTLYTFHPKHATFYKRMMDFDLAAELREGHAVENAPAILMRGELNRIIARWKKIVFRRESARRHAVTLTLSQEPLDVGQR